MPNDQMNQLKTWMDFYQQNGPQPLVTGPGGDSPAAWNQKLMQNNALKFALQQQQGQMQPSRQMPDYFGGQSQPAYVPPTATAPNPTPFPAINGGKPQGPPPQYQNFLQQLFNRQLQQFPSVGFRG